MGRPDGQARNTYSDSNCKTWPVTWSGIFSSSQRMNFPKLEVAVIPFVWVTPPIVLMDAHQP